MRTSIIYSRVSSVGQSTDRQINELNDLDDYQVKRVFNESISGFTKSINERPVLQSALKYIQTNKIQTVLVHEVSRLGRNTIEVLQLIERLKGMGVGVYVKSLGIEINRGGKDDPFNKLIITLMADIARLESETMSFRIKSGLEERKRKGLAIGRRLGSIEESEKFLSKYRPVVRYLKRGESIRWIANQTNMSPTTVQKVKNTLQYQ